MKKLFHNKVFIITLCILLALISLPILKMIGYECPWHKLFGIECAGCGATRMIYALFRLEIYQAFRYNVLMFSLLVLGIIYLIYVFICKLRHVNYFVPGNKTLYVIAIIVILFMILRNIPGLEFLKPTDL